jgi:hypothetical protein
VLRWSEEENECFLFKKQRIYTKGGEEQLEKTISWTDERETEKKENIYTRKTEKKENIKRTYIRERQKTRDRRSTM